MFDATVCWQTSEKPTQEVGGIIFFLFFFFPPCSTLCVYITTSFLSAKPALIQGTVN